ncbi:MAG TPA: prolyl oligopeptidase family serine peptidase [Sedimentisphaerales bacterium]|nr:prolyl oligopeptidase family serine peptidase [Sedimentisphaerales bacterium]
MKQAVTISFSVVFLSAGSIESIAQDGPRWPEVVKEITYVSSADSTAQPALFYAPRKEDGPRPLLVGLHTWSGNCKQTMSIPYAEWCIEKDWVFIHPNFRGPNKSPEATGSELVVKDILSAVDYAKCNANVDPNRVYLVGASGGGYTALLMAGRAPHIWAGVSAWAPIADLRAWYFECKETGRRYAGDIVKSCGDVPGANAEVDREYKKRSPITYLRNGVQVPLDINAGINDGHTGSVPVSHSLRAFNLVAAAEDRISEEDIRFFAEKAQVPVHLKAELSDAAYGKKAPLFRRSSGKARVTIFDGGHEIIYEAALSWLAGQEKTNTQ